MGNLVESVKDAFETFGTLDPDRKPDLITLGLPALDEIIGGILPGTCGILGAAQGVGKSSLVLQALLTNSIPSGYIGLEDPSSEFGARVLSHFTGVPGGRIRMNALTPSERKRCQEVLPVISEALPHIETIVGGSLEQVKIAVRKCVDAGCRIVWLDYLHKIKGVSDNRTQEVSRAYTEFQRECAEQGVACMVVCQFSRKDIDERPHISWLKDTGDLENEARIILLAHPPKEHPGYVLTELAKWSYGPGAGSEFFYRRGTAGTLEPASILPFAETRKLSL